MFMLIKEKTFKLLNFLYTHPYLNTASYLMRIYSLSHLEKKIKEFERLGLIKIEKKKPTKTSKRYFYLTFKGVEIIINLRKINNLLNKDFKEEDEIKTLFDLKEVKI